VTADLNRGSVSIEILSEDGERVMLARSASATASPVIDETPELRH